MEGGFREDPPHEEAGAVAVMVSVSLLLLFLVAATVIDLGFARADVRQNQSISDFASLAAADALETGYVAGCQSALNYVYANADELAAPPPSSALNECAAFAGLDSSGCTAGSPPVEVTVEAGPYTILLGSPVPDGDPIMTSDQTVDADIDGTPCERIKATVLRDRDYLFAGVAGFTTGTATADAVARQVEVGTEEEFASLVVLEQEDCEALAASGTGSAVVDPEYEHIKSGFLVRNRTLADGTVLDGTIAVDSSGNGACSGQELTVDHGTSWIYAEGQIGLFALNPSPTGNPPRAYDDAAPSDRLGEDVVRRPTRMTRQSIDWLVNCRASYPSSTTHQRFPRYADDRGPCPFVGEPDRDAYVDQLYDALQTGTLTGFETISDCSSPIVKDGALGDPRGYYVTCDPSTAGTLIFRNVDHVVFAADQHVSKARLIVEGDSATGTVVYMRGSGFRQTTGTSGVDICDAAIATHGLCLKNAFVYIDSAGDGGPESQDPSVTFNGGMLHWRGLPTSARTNCTTSHSSGAVLPNAACFAPLSLWSNSYQDHSFAGNGGALVSGSYFMPNATVSLSGGSAFDFEDAQFYANTMESTGNGAVKLVPNPDTNVPDPIYGVGLIR